MKRSSLLLPIAMLVAIGCSAEPEATVDSNATESTQTVQTPAGTDSEAVTFVSLKVPNMV